MAKKEEKFIIIDGNALVHRAFHALPPTMQTKNGQMVNAVYGFALVLLKVLKDLKPDYIAVTFDLKGPTFRHLEYKEYKANRAKQADELYEQFPLVKDLVKSFNIPIYEKQGFEADDVIATLVKHKEVEKIKSIIVTGDMDTLQLVDKNTEVYTMQKGMSETITYDVAQVKKRYDGLSPSQIIDFKALRGDPSDNIPGVKGIGEKGAITLLTDFKTIENLYKNIDSPKIKDRYRELLKTYEKDAMMSKKLATMIDSVPIKFNLEDARLKNYDLGTIIPLFQSLEFKSLIGKLPKENQTGTAPGQDSFKFGDETIKTMSPGYKLINDEKSMAEFLGALQKQKEFAVDTETTGLDPFTAELLGLSFSWEKGSAYYVVAQKKFLEKLRPILEDEKIIKIGHNIKFDMEVLETAGIKIKPIGFDTMIASYLISPGTRQHGLDNLVFSELGHQMQPITELIGKGKNQISLKDVNLNKVSNYACEDADFTFRLYQPLKKQLKEKNNLELLEKIEVPLIPVLAEVERNGVLVDTEFLNSLGKKVGQEINQLENEIYKLSKTRFNIASPIQLKEVLFEKMNISTQGLGHTKTGVSTAASELDKLKDKHPIINSVIRYRELAKLKSTYLDALPSLVDLSGRIHTSYNQTVAATGRLSSSDPNLQNIPIRTELGAQIRKAFIAPRGFKILAADYSQIELRIVASLANDKKMIETFKRGEDIHTTTAAAINNVAEKDVTKQMRYNAKAVNFGIIYGQGPVGLSQVTGISRSEAMNFIDNYFLTFSSIKVYLEKIKEFAEKNGYVETYFGRRRYLPEINSSMQPVRAAAERAAINHPIQGTAADLLKLAMIEIHKKLPKISPTSKMILQVHDELVFEVPEKEIAKVAKFIKEEMAGVYKLKAPVETDVLAGPSWGELSPLK